MSEIEGEGESSPISTDEPVEKVTRQGVMLKFTGKVGKLFTKNGIVYPGQVFKVTKAEAKQYLTRPNINEVSE